MTIGTRTAGAWASGSTSLSPALPASRAAGDMMILFVGAKPYTATINQPTGWTRIGTQQTNGTVANGTDVGSVTWSVFYRAWQSGDAAPSVSVTSGNVSLGCINGFTKTASAWITPTAYFGSDASSGTGYSATAASSSGAITNGDRLLHGTVIAGNNSTFGTPTLTATGATIGAVTESPATEGTTATGLDLEASAAHAGVTAGTSSADVVCGWTLSVAQTGGSALVRLREDSTQTLTPSLFTDTSTFHSPTVTPGAVTLTPALYENTITFYAPTVTTGGGAQTLSQDARFDNTATFYAPTVSPGAVTLTVARYDNAPSFPAATVTPGAVTLTPAQFDNAQAFHAPTLAPGTVTLTAALLENTATLYAPAVTPGVVVLTAARLDGEQIFYAPTVTPGAVPLTAQRLDNTSAFYAPTVASDAVTLIPSLLENAQSFPAATVAPGEVTLAPTRADNTSAFYSPTVTAQGGAQTLTQTAPIDGAQSFPAATVTPGPLTLLPALIENTSAAFGPTVENASYPITREQARQLYRLYLLHGLDLAAPLTVTTATRSAGPVTQSVDVGDGSIVTIATTLQPDLVPIHPGTMIEELAALHGLGVELVVTAEQRVAGAITQLIAQSSGNTTVTRQ